jgi:hypothetical protein
LNLIKSREYLIEYNTKEQTITGPAAWPRKKMYTMRNKKVTVVKSEAPF